MDPNCMELVNQSQTLVEAGREKSAATNWRDQFQMYREEDRHECNLISSRFNVLLYSQTVLAAIGGFLYQEKHYGAVLAVAILSFLLSEMTCIAIYIGCRVLAGWHRHGKRLIQEAGKEQGQMGRYFLAGRSEMPDILHTISIDYFSCGVPVLFGAASFLAIEYVWKVRLLRGWVTPTVWLVIASSCWVAAMIWVHWRTKDLHEHKDDGKGPTGHSPSQIGAKTAN